MPRTQLRSEGIEDGGVKRPDLNISEPGNAVVRRLLQGGGITLSSTGADSGTGDVTVSLQSTIAPTAITPPLTAHGVQNLMATSMFEYGDKFRWGQPIATQVLNSGEWVSGGFMDDVRFLTDGRPDSQTRLSSAYTGVRMTFQLDWWSAISCLRYSHEYPQPSSWSIRVEQSTDNATWSDRIATRTISSYDMTYLLYMDDRGTFDYPYVRITLIRLDTPSDNWNLVSIEALTFRPGNQGGAGLARLLPMTWNYLKNVEFPAAVKVPQNLEVNRQIYVVNATDGLSNILFYDPTWSHGGYCTYVQGSKEFWLGGTHADSTVRLTRKVHVGISGSTRGELTLYPSNAGSWLHLHNNGAGELVISHGPTPGTVDIMRIGASEIAAFAPITTTSYFKGVHRSTSNNDGITTILSFHDGSDLWAMEVEDGLIVAAYKQ